MWRPTDVRAGVERRGDEFAEAQQGKHAGSPTGSHTWHILVLIHRHQRRRGSVQVACFLTAERAESSGHVFAPPLGDNAHPAVQRGWHMARQVDDAAIQLQVAQFHLLVLFVYVADAVWRARMGVEMRHGKAKYGGTYLGT
jgi:hypothetical protein